MSYSASVCLDQPDGGDIPVAHFLVARAFGHVLFQLGQRVKGPLGDPGRATGLADLPVVGIDAKEANPVDDLGAHPVVDRVVDRTGDVHADVLPGAGVDVEQILKAVRARGVIAAVLDQDLAVVEQVVGQDAVNRLPVDRADKPFKVIHRNPRLSPAVRLTTTLPRHQAGTTATRWFCQARPGCRRTRLQARVQPPRRR